MPCNASRLDLFTGEKLCLIGLKYNFTIAFRNYYIKLAHVLTQVALAYVWVQLSIYFELSRTGIKKEALRILLLRRTCQ